LVLEGDEHDEHGRYQTGDFVANVPGSEHSVKTERGNTVLIVWEAPIAAIEQLAQEPTSNINSRP
jgi:anti-sigma factor ChrR (cupin superfamily)